MATVKDILPRSISPVIAMLAGGVMLWAWLGSGDQPEGCYRIDKGTRLVLADGRMRLIGKHAGEARIVAVDQVRGWVVRLDRTLSYDPARPSEARFVQDAPQSRANSLFIDERFGEYPAILFHPEKGADVRFPEVACVNFAAG